VRRSIIFFGLLLVLALDLIDVVGKDAKGHIVTDEVASGTQDGLDRLEKAWKKSTSETCNHP